MAPDATLPLIGGRHHFMLRRLHSLSGIIFGGYLVVHLIVNASIAQAGQVFQWQVDKIHQLPFLWALEWGLIYLPILFHIFYGVWIALTGQPNVGKYGYSKNWLYLMQRTSGLILTVFIFFHVFALKYGWFGDELKFEHGAANLTIHRHMVTHPWIAYTVYPIGILASCFHWANGFWTAGITWGLTISAQAQRRWGVICALAGCLLLVAGMVALVASIQWHPAEGAAPAARFH